MRTKDIKTKLKDHFLLNPTSRLRVRQIERELKAPLPSVIRYTKELEQEGMVQRIVIAKVTFFAANRTSAVFLQEKRLFNLRSLYRSGLIEFLIQEYSNPTIVLFGSYARGEDIESSDIDLYVESSKISKIDLTSFEKKLHRKIELFVHKKISFIKNKELVNTIINGITLHGFLEVLK